ncbi:DUF1768-domain-containing protein, partial [Schizophyllum fasciatum]
PDQRIHFHDKQTPHYSFTNFSPHPVIYKDKEYPTCEHLFQAFKVRGRGKPHLAERIRICSGSPRVALQEAQRLRADARRDWKDVSVEKMEKALWHKFTQHRDLRRELLATGDAVLIENSPTDSFWGIGEDGKGRNELGKALMRLRMELAGY